MVGRTAALALVLMLVQNSGFVLVMRYSRHQQQREHTAQYSPAVVVVMQELFKLAVCLVATTVQQSGRAGTITQFSKQTGYRVTFDDTGSGAPHEDFGIVAIRKLLAAANDT